MEGFGIGFSLAIIICAFLPNTAVTKEEWEWATSSCAANGGFDEIRGAGSIRSASVTCKNGADFKLARP